MSDISGFDWWFRDRDYVLRENLEALQTSAAMAASRNASLSSQLSRLQGSLEHRLNALSSAFDAYVQLGDVREQLAAYGEAATIRREAMAAIGALGDGRPAESIDDRGTGYWVAAATNAVIARVSGTPDLAAEESLPGQESDAALFLVAALGALGHGAEVADRVARMLHSEDGSLDDHQVDLWHAAVRGDFGPDVIRNVLVDWNDQLRSRPDSDWWDWASRLGSQVGRDALGWIEYQASDQIDGHDRGAPGLATSQPDGGDQQPAGGGLRGLVLELINSGFGDEKQLLATARELRSKIEHPGSTMPADDTAAQPGTPIIEVVRTSYAALAPSPVRSEILAALAPSLAAAVEAEAPGLLSEVPAVVRLRIAGVSVDVTPTGPDRQALDKAVAVATASTDPRASKARLYGFGIAAAACAAIALVLAVAGLLTWLVVLLLIAAVITGVLAIRTLLAARRETDRLAREAADRDRSITEAVERADRSQMAQREAVRKTADQLDRIQALLSGAGPTGSAVGSSVGSPVTEDQQAATIGS